MAKHAWRDSNTPVACWQVSLVLSFVNHVSRRQLLPSAYFQQVIADQPSMIGAGFGDEDYRKNSGTKAAYRLAQ
jgi:hypothetical protein